MSGAGKFFTTYRILGLLGAVVMIVIILLVIGAMYAPTPIKPIFPYEPVSAQKEDTSLKPETETTKAVAPSVSHSQEDVGKVSTELDEETKQRLLKLYRSYNIHEGTFSVFPGVFSEMHSERIAENRGFYSRVVQSLLEYLKLSEEFTDAEIFAFEQENNVSLNMEILRADIIGLIREGKAGEARDEFFHYSRRRHHEMSTYELPDMLVADAVCADLAARIAEAFPQPEYLDFALQEITPVDPDQLPTEKLMLTSFRMAEKQITYAAGRLNDRKDKPQFYYLFFLKEGWTAFNLRRETYRKLSDEHAYLRSCLEELRPSMNRPLPELLKIVKQTQSDYAPLEVNDRKVDYYCNVDLSRTLTRDLYLVALDADKINASLIKAALFKYRALHGAFPASLDALAPEIIPSVPVDCFTGRDFIYHPAETGFILYSPGGDLVDNNAASPILGAVSLPREAMGILEGEDIAFSYSEEKNRQDLQD